jgi:arsenate reductase
MKDAVRRELVLFVCTHNSARSQMAEGILRQLHGDRFEAHSAGTIPTSVDPRAITVMAEIGIDISNQRSKSVSEFYGKNIDYVVTLCDDAKQTCPFFPGGKEYIHRGFADPVDNSRSEEDLTSFRQVRDDIRDWISRVFGKMKKDEVAGDVRLELSSV